MGLHLVALAKLKLLAPCHNISPLLASLVCPFVIRVACSLRCVRRTYFDLLYASRLFFFQMGRIAFDAEPGPGNGSRWRRALRLVCQRVTDVGRLPASQSEEVSFHTLTILSL
ncbi:hypothetical protein SLE2022_226720 [Rubroshorea leprosula]